MKIVVIGGSGLIGSNVVARLRAAGHDVVAASPQTGVNAVTGEGLPEALAGAQVVVDVANSPSFEDKAVLEFFETSTRNLLAAGKAAGVGHHVALTVVGTTRNPQIGYFRAKRAQEQLIEASGLPYSILHATQFFEFIKSIIQSGADGDAFRLSPALVQPMAATDVAEALAGLAIGTPLNAAIEIGGPARIPLDELARQYLAAHGNTHAVITDIHYRYFGSELDDRSLVTEDGAQVGPTGFEQWLRQDVTAAA